MAAGGHFGLTKITFDRFFGKKITNGCRSIKMAANHFRSFQINRQLLFSQNGNKNYYFFVVCIIWLSVSILDYRKSLSIAFLAISDQYAFFNKMAAGGHFGCPKITFDRISRHFRSIRNFIFCWFFFTKWLPAAILDDRKSLLISFLAISDQYATFILFHKMAASGHFGWPKITFNHITRHFRSKRNFSFFWFFFSKWPPFLEVRFGPFWMIENYFRSHFSPFQINTQLLFCFTKWLPAAILDFDRKSLLIALLAISDQTETFLFFWFFFQNGRRLPFWKNDLGHFGWSKITFDGISRHFRSIHNLVFFY